MEVFFSVLVLILIILKYILFLDIILSWLTIFGLHVRPKFISDIMDPIYKFIKSKIPTTIGPIDFTPIIVIIVLIFLMSFLILLTGDNNVKLNEINNYFL